MALFPSVAFFKRENFCLFESLSFSGRKLTILNAGVPFPFSLVMQYLDGLPDRFHHSFPKRDD